MDCPGGLVCSGLSWSVLRFYEVLHTDISAHVEPLTGATPTVTVTATANPRIAILQDHRKQGLPSHL